MAEPGTPSGRSFTEGEAYALVSDAVARETASAQAEVQSLTERLSAADTERETAAAALTAAETARDAAIQELADFKAGIEAQKAAEGKRTERLAKLAEVAPNLKIEDERATRIVAMSDEAFDEMVETVRESASATKPAEEEPPKGGVPRESAAFKGKDADGGDAPKGSVLGLIGAARGIKV